MKMTSRMFRAGALAVSICLALVLAVGGSASGDSTVSKKKKPVFKPKKYAGEWSGMWTNHTFDTSGDSSMDLKVKGKGKKMKFIGIFDLAGTAFGCDDPAPRKRVMTKGNGKDDNTWGKKGFNVSYENDFGPIELNYKVKGNKISGSGTSPCSDEIAYTFEGKMTTKKVDIETDITFDGEPLANSSLKLKKAK